MIRRPARPPGEYSNAHGAVPSVMKPWRSWRLMAAVLMSTRNLADHRPDLLPIADRRPPNGQRRNIMRLAVSHLTFTQSRVYPARRAASQGRCSGKRHIAIAS